MKKAVIVTTDHGTRFKLEPDQMVEVNPNGRPYSAFRIDLRDSLRNPEFKLTYTYDHVAGGRATTSTEIVLGESFVKIGCKTFSGENFRKLNEWALSMALG